MGSLVGQEVSSSNQKVAGSNPWFLHTDTEHKIVPALTLSECPGETQVSVSTV